MAGVLLAGLVMCAGSLWLLGSGTAGPDVPSLLVGVVGTAFFVPCTVLAAATLARGGGVTLTPEGVDVRTAMGRAHLPWESIGGADLLVVQGRTSLALVLRPGAPARLSAGHRWLRRVNARMGLPGDVFVPDTMVPGLEELLAAVHAALRARA